MKVGSLFSGVGGLDLGLERAGMETAWQVELDPRCRSVLRRHFPETIIREDVTSEGRTTLPPVDLICGGFPCQDLSVAGRRAGLAGERSGLFFEFARIVGELRPEWVLVENVPGLLSSNGGRDMGAAVGTLGQLGYRWAYRVLDAQYLGVAQRRRRVFIVGHLGDGRGPEVLFDAASLSRNPPSRGEAGARVAGCLGASSAASGRGGVDDNSAQAGHVVAHAVSARDAKGPGDAQAMPVLAFNWQSGGDCRLGLSEERTDALHVGQVPAIAHTLREGRLFELHGAVHAPSGTQVDGVLDIAPRRLTPMECERLQGFPDDWTRYGKGEEISDSARYRMLGNAVAVPVARWIGERIMEVK